VEDVEISDGQSGEASLKTQKLHLKSWRSPVVGKEYTKPGAQKRSS
jgi:hypothetical protein